MINAVKNNLFLNKFEKTSLIGVMSSAAVFIGMCNVYWVLNKCGIHLASGTVQDIIDAVAAGTSLSTAFAAIAGITLPAWAVAGAAALGATAA